MIVFYLKWTALGRSSLEKKIVVPLMVLIIVMPYVSAYISLSYTLSTVSNITDKTLQISYVSNYVLQITESIWGGDEYVKFHRSQNDFLKHLMVGIGACGEMSMVSTILLSYLGFESRRIAFPGEDHVFVEVRLNDTWMVADPGYYGSQIMTREERGLRRIEEFGALSYVVAFSDNAFMEVTKYYTRTDTIAIRVTYGGEPRANAEIFLKHTFQGRENRLPGQKLVFHSNANGTVVLHMGPLSYNQKASTVEPYFWIYVNGQNTGCNVTSTGSGRIHNIEIDLTN